jgi:hypothetical protein
VLIAAPIGTFNHAESLLSLLTQSVVHPAQVGIKPHIAFGKIIAVNIRRAIKSV